MKKFIIAILAVLYISASTGATVYMHYCMGKISEWGIEQNGSKICGKCGMEKTESKDKGCCKDEFKFFKNDTVQKITENHLQIFQLLSTAIPSSYIELPNVEFSDVNLLNPISHDPPRTNPVAVYIRNCVFLI